MTTIVVDVPTIRIDVTGDDRTRYLEDVTTQHLVDVPVTHVRSTLVLDGNGGPTAMFDVVVLGDRLTLLVPDETAAATVLDVLAMRTFLLDARFARCDGEAVVAVRGPDAPEVVSAAGLTVVEGRCRVAGDLLLVSQPGGIDVVGPPAAVAEAVADLEAAGARRGGERDLDAWRVAAGVPAWGVEVVAPHLPEEAGVLPTHVHLAKGCYPGQEAVARMWMLGRPRRRLARVVADAAVPAGWQAGTGRRAAQVTTVADDGLTALAYVPGAADVGERFTGDDGVSIEVVELVGATATPPGHDPAVTRRRDKPRG